MSRPTKHARKLEGRWIRCLDEKTDLLIVRSFHCNTLQAALRVTVQNLLQHLSVEVSRMSSQETAKKSPEAARSQKPEFREERPEGCGEKPGGCKEKHMCTASCEEFFYPLHSM